MITKQMSVEIQDNKRVDDNGQALYSPSDLVRVKGAKLPVARASLTEKQLEEGEFFNVYTGTVVEAEASDFTSPEAITALANRIHVDLYANDDEPMADGYWISDILNNGGLRLAYGDAIKKAHKLAGTGGMATKLVAGEWFMSKLTNGTVSTEERTAYVTATDKLAYVLKLWLASGSPR